MFSHRTALVALAFISSLMLGVAHGGPALAQNQPPTFAAPGGAPPPPPEPGGGAPALDNGAGAAANGEADVQTRGPVHEAFAEPYDYNPKPSSIVPRQPPEPINEIAPDVKPEGDRVEWIPGYWAWDEDRQDYLWVSGLWRKFPPGRRWVPGYWANQDNGFRWVSGSWVQEQAQELEYLPQPPESLEAGPNVAAPSNGHFWVPGSWAYVNLGYRWRPGYWSPCYENWVWVPARYSWTPRGVFYSRGYWDFVIADRGVLFAPSYFAPVVYRRPGFAFSPSVVVSLGGLSSHLFVGLNFGHYYFGDYYGDAYLRRGFTPWYACSRRGCYDPLLTYYASDYRRTGRGDYIALMHTEHDRFVAHAELRPPHTFLAQQQWANKVTDPRLRQAGQLGRPLGEVGKGVDNHFKMVKLADNQRVVMQQSNKQMRELVDARRDMEHQGGKPGGVGARPGDNGKNGGPIAGGPGGDPAKGGGKNDSPRLRLPSAVGLAGTGDGNTPGRPGRGDNPRGVGNNTGGPGTGGNTGAGPNKGTGGTGPGAGGNTGVVGPNKGTGGTGTGTPGTGRPGTVNPGRGTPGTGVPGTGTPGTGGNTGVGGPNKGTGNNPATGGTGAGGTGTGKGPVTGGTGKAPVTGGNNTPGAGGNNPGFKPPRRDIVPPGGDTNPRGRDAGGRDPGNRDPGGRDAGGRDPGGRDKVKKPNQDSVDNTPAAGGNSPRFVPPDRSTDRPAQKYQRDSGPRDSNPGQHDRSRERPSRAATGGGNDGPKVAIPGGGPKVANDGAAKRFVPDSSSRNTNSARKGSAPDESRTRGTKPDSDRTKRDDKAK